MNKLLPVIPLAVFLAASCQQNSPKVATLPPIVAKKPPTVSKPKKRSYRSSSSSRPKTDSAATTLTKSEGFDPLNPNPTDVTPIVEIPRFEVPDNLQPKVSDGINQGEFIELKW